MKKCQLTYPKMGFLLDWADAPEITRSLNSEYSFYGNYSLVGKNNNQIKRILFESDGIGRIMAIF